MSLLFMSKLGADGNIFSKETFSGALSRCYPLALIILDKPPIGGHRSCEVGDAPICSATTIDSLSDTFVAAGEAAISVQMLGGL